jgi:hypothetical protein
MLPQISIKATWLAAIVLSYVLINISCTSQKEKSMETKLAITGIAKNSKAGAIVLTTDSNIYYVEGMDRWSDEVENTMVTVTGEMYTTETKAEDLKNEKGEYTQGSVGVKKIIKQAIVQKKK